MTEDVKQKSGGKISSFLHAETAGMPNWVWLLVIGAGIAAAIVIPKFLNGSKTNAADQASSGTGTGASGLGLAIDPSTGLPYAVEGLVPSGGIGNSTNLDLSSTNALLQQLINAQKPTPTPTPTGGHDHDSPNYGLLGPNIAVNFTNRTYKNSTGSWVPIPIPHDAKLVQGSQNRVWFTIGGKQFLLTSGIGPASSQKVYQPGTEFKAAHETGGTSGSVSPSHFNVRSGRGSVSFANDETQIQSEENSVLVGPTSVNVTSPEGSIDIARRQPPTHRDGLTWPYIFELPEDTGRTRY